MPNQDTSDLFWYKHDFIKAVDYVISKGWAHTGKLQIELRCGFIHASRLIKAMQSRKIISEEVVHSKGYRCLITQEEWIDIKEKLQQEL